VVAVALLAVVALRVLPRRVAVPPTRVDVPRPRTLALLGLVGIVLVLFLLYPVPEIGAHQPAFTTGWWILVPMVVAAALLVGAYRLIRRWSTSRRWTDVHALALAGGALVAHSLVGAAGGVATTTFDRVGLVAIAALTAVLCLVAGRRLARRSSPAESSDVAADVGSGAR